MHSGRKAYLPHLPSFPPQWLSNFHWPCRRLSWADVKLLVPRPRPRPRPRADICYSYVAGLRTNVKCLLQLQMQSLLLPWHKSFEKVRGHMLFATSSLWHTHVRPMSTTIVKCLIYARQQHELRIADGRICCCCCFYCCRLLLPPAVAASATYLSIN